MNNETNIKEITPDSIERPSSILSKISNDQNCENYNFEDNDQLNDQSFQKLQIQNINISQLVANHILDKIISLSMTRVYTKCIEKKLGDHCFNFITNSITPLITQTFISTDKEIYNPNKSECIYNNNSLCYNTIKNNKINTWVEIAEPSTQEKDRGLSTQIKIIEYQEESDRKLFNIKDIAVPNKENEDKQNKKEISKLIIKNNNELLISLKEEKEHEEQEKIKKEQLEKQKKQEQKDINDYLSEEEDKENDKIDIIDLPSYDLPECKYINKFIQENETPEINEMRKEVEIIKKKKEDERRIAKKKAKREKMAIAMKNQKDFDSKTYTFDPNGKVILKKPHSVDLLAKEFWWSKPLIKDGITKRNSQYLIPIKTNKQTQNDFNESQSSSPSKLRKSNNDVIYNNTTNSNGNNIQRYKFNNKRKENPIKPSGENFRLFIPEVGVSITSSNNQKKVGGLNYSMKFNKPSMREFSLLALESKQFKSKKYTSSFTGIYSSTNSEPNSYLGYAQQFTKETNPLLQGSSNPIPISSEINRELPYLHNSSSHKNLHLSKLSDSIVLKHDDISKLKLALYDDEGEREYDNYNCNIISNPVEARINFHNLKQARNVFRKNFSFVNKKSKDIYENYMDKFNSKILKHKNWGSYNALQQDKVLKLVNSFKKPSKQTNINEMGLRIAMTKMPRSRIKEKGFEKYQSVQIDKS